MAGGNEGVLNLRAQAKQFNHLRSCPINPSPPRSHPSDVAAIKAAIATIQQKLPFLITLTDAERKSLPKAGAHSLSFVEHAQTAADNNPTILPGSFNAARILILMRDLFAVLTDVGTRASRNWHRCVDDTRMAVGSEAAMNEAWQVYEYVKSATKNTPGLKPVADQLGERFQHTWPPPNPPRLRRNS